MHSRNRFRYKYSNIFGNNSILFEMLKKMSTETGSEKMFSKKMTCQGFFNEPFSVSFYSSSGSRGQIITG